MSGSVGGTRGVRLLDSLAQSDPVQGADGADGEGRDDCDEDGSDKDSVQHVGLQ